MSGTEHVAVQDSVTLVVTPPSPYGMGLMEKLGARTTFGTVVEVITRARHSLLIATPFVSLSRELAIGPLAVSLRDAARRRVRIEVISTPSGIQSFREGLIDLASDECVSFFQPTDRLSLTSLGSHAKVFIADDNVAYVGSANLTGPGMNRNLEIGVLLKGALAVQVSSLWQYLIGSGFLERSP